MPRFASNISLMFGEVPFLDRFEEAARAGFAAVEYGFPYAYPANELGVRLRHNALAQAVFNLSPGDWHAGDRGLAAIPGREHEFAASVVTALRYAEELECTRIHAMAGIVPDAQDPDRFNSARATYLRNLRFAADEAAPQGITILIEPLNPRDNPGYFLTTQAEAHAIREELGLPNLLVQMDLYHAQMTEGDLSDKIRRWIAHVGHMQIAGVPGRHEPDFGEINYPFLFDLIDELEYSGWVGCEYRPRNGTHAGLHWRDRLSRRAAISTEPVSG